MSKNETRVLTAVFTGAVLLVCLMAFSVMVAVAPFNPISTKLQVGAEINTLIPEGWAFFTRNAREPDFFYYEKIDGEWGRMDRYFPNSTPLNAFGMNRRSRAITTEMVLLLQKMPAGAWVESEEVLNAFNVAALDTAKAYAVSNTLPVPYLCGDIAIVMAEPIPWAYRQGGEEEISNFRAVFLQSNCQNQ
ncbi:SdpA family antimicrobial peptide system protein [Neolewinella aurantiaca]|uniref:SdpA family antimicrobial peptide system protein n=1 Tax=Neolewinella aurantiaca TaxID=2602767 RepID=A0A5C7FHD8_9BACT|nr:SdpA family antimicrobial peptide system protein [Neolewinella aurantiaca]TXF85704.1 SdpA family antimicrobial peptide system protein [Neolewinella aurantiaca]